MILFVYLLLIITLMISTLLIVQCTFLIRFQFKDATQGTTLEFRKTVYLIATLLLLVGTTHWLLGLERQTAFHSISMKKLKSSLLTERSQLSETMDSLLDEKTSLKPTSTTTTTLMYVRIYEDKVYINTPESLQVYGIERESVPSLVSFVEEHGLELNTHLIQTEDGIWLAPRTFHDFCGLLSRLRPWLYHLSGPLEGTQK